MPQINEIPDDVLAKYGMESLETRMQILGAVTDEQIKQVRYYFYTEFLNNTDYEILSAFEKLFSEPTKLLTNFISVAKEYSDIIKYRAFARGELLK